MSEEVELPLRCPKCLCSESLYELVSISGWRGIDIHGEPDGEREADWDDVTPTGEAGCGECGWEGFRDSLSFPLGIDGERLPDPIPGQITIGEEQ